MLTESDTVRTGYIDEIIMNHVSSKTGWRDFSRGLQSVLLVIFGFAFSVTTVAETPISSRAASAALVEIVSNSASIVRYRNEVLVADWRVKQRVAEDAPQVSFSTSGKFPLTDNIESVRDRVSDADRRYLDGILRVSKSMYDWGRNESLVQAEEFRRRSALQLYEMTFEREFAKLLVLVIDHLKVSEQLRLLNTDAEFLGQTTSAVRQRYEAGAGSLDDVRRLELRRLDLDRDREQAENLKVKIEDTVKKVFKVDVTKLQPSVLEIIKIFPNPKAVELNPTQLMVAANSSFEQRALDFEIESILSDKRPSVTGTVTSRLFNLTTDPLAEYEVYGGIEVDFPVFDGGARDARVQGLNTQKIVTRSELREELDRVDEGWFELTAEQQNKETMIQQEEQRLATLRLRIDSLKKRLEAVQVTIVDLADVELSRTQSIRSLKGMEWDLVRIAVQKIDAADKLLAHLDVEIPF